MTELADTIADVAADVTAARTTAQSSLASDTRTAIAGSANERVAQRATAESREAAVETLGTDLTAQTSDKRRMREEVHDAVLAARTVAQ